MRILCVHYVVSNRVIHIYWRDHYIHTLLYIYKHTSIIYFDPKKHHLFAVYAFEKSHQDWNVDTVAYSKWLRRIRAKYTIMAFVL